jgi:hypothetical protein
MRASGSADDLSFELGRSLERQGANRGWLQAVVLAVVATACAGSAPGDPVEQAPADGNVSRAEFGSTWPLTIDRGQILCQPVNEVVMVAPDGGVYALNGAARGSANAWLDGVDLLLPGKTPADLAGLIEIGLGLCD